MRAIIVEDEINVREAFMKMLQSFAPVVEIVGVAGSVKEAQKLKREKKFDILFLDINLPDGTGFDIVKDHQETDDYKIIFVTAYDKYAVDAFKLCALDYLLKPISPPLLIRAVERARVDLFQQKDKINAASQLYNNRKDGNNKIALKKSEGIVLVSLRDIVYCKAEGSYTLFKLINGKEILTSTNLKEYEDMLKDYAFVRSHHSYLSNLYHIIEVRKKDGGNLLMENGETIPLSYRKRSDVIQGISGLFLS